MSVGRGAAAFLVALAILATAAVAVPPVAALLVRWWAFWLG